MENIGKLRAWRRSSLTADGSPPDSTAWLMPARLTPDLHILYNSVFTNLFLVFARIQHFKNPVKYSEKLRINQFLLI
jgi:hypothetical protein